MQLIGFAFGYPTADEIKLWEVPNKIRFARLEVGEDARLPNGRALGPYYWKKWELPQEEMNTVAKAILRDQEISAHNFRAFTLFWNGARTDRAGNKITPGFQMSVQMKDDKGGWSIRRITEEQADMIFGHLRYIPSPTGPWELTADIRSDLRDSFIVSHSAANNWQKTEKRAETEYFDIEPGEDDLTTLLAASAEAVEAGTAALAALVAGKR